MPLQRSDDAMFGSVPTVNSNQHSLTNAVLLDELD